MGHGSYICSLCNIWELNLRLYVQYCNHIWAHSYTWDTKSLTDHWAQSTYFSINMLHVSSLTSTTIIRIIICFNYDERMSNSFIYFVSRLTGFNFWDSDKNNARMGDCLLVTCDSYESRVHISLFFLSLSMWLPNSSYHLILLASYYLGQSYFIF